MQEVVQKPVNHRGRPGGGMTWRGCWHSTKKPGTIYVPGSLLVGYRLAAVLFLLQRLHVIHDVGEFLSCHGLLQVSGHEADLLFDQFFNL